MRLTKIVGEDCGRDDCPTVFSTDRGSIAVKGYVVSHDPATGEAIVEIPIAVFQEAAGALGR